MGMLGLWRKGKRLSDCRRTSKDDKERIVKERSFLKKKLAVLTDLSLEEKTWLSSTRRLVSLHSRLRSFHDCCPKVAVEEAQESWVRSG
jgi:hypothetical protein